MESKLALFAEEIINSVKANSAPREKLGKDLQDALIRQDAKKLFESLTQKDFATSLAAATVNTDSRTKLVKVLQYRTRQEGFTFETYETEVYLTFPKDTTAYDITESTLRERFMAPLTAFMLTAKGQKAWESTCHDFNWGDWVQEIPESVFNANGIFLTPNAQVADTFVWNVHQDEIIGFGIEEMTDEQVKALYLDLAREALELTADTLESHPERYPNISVDDADIKAMRRQMDLNELKPLVAETLEDEGLNGDVLNHEAECVEAVYSVYRTWRANEPQ